MQKLLLLHMHVPLGYTGDVSKEHDTDTQTFLCSLVIFRLSLSSLPTSLFNQSLLIHLFCLVFIFLFAFSSLILWLFHSSFVIPFSSFLSFWMLFFTHLYTVLSLSLPIYLIFFLVPSPSSVLLPRTTSSFLSLLLVCFILSFFLRVLNSNFITSLCFILPCFQILLKWCVSHHRIYSMAL